MDFSSLHIVDYILLGSLLLLFVLQMYFYIRYLAAPARKMRRDKKSQISNVQSQISNVQSPISEGVSVILCAHNEGYNLSQFLPSLLTQDYPLYEVIVVDDGSEDNTRAVVESFMANDPRLHLTFVPCGARIGSTKKLALTLGAKAAQYDLLLLTDADCVPESDHWISKMVKGFGNVQGDNIPSTKDIVLGFGAYFAEDGHINRLVRYDTLFNGLHYLGAALCGHPYMGVGRNLAYRKSLFFESGGFTRLMTNKAGDDDLFVNHVATRDNTSVILSRESYTWSVSKKTLKEWWQQKRRHLSVSPAYRPVTKFRLTLEPLTRGLFYLALMVVIAYSLYFLPCGEGRGEVLYIALLLFLLRWLVQTLVINVSARRMGLRTFSPWTIQWFDIILPLVNLWMLIVPKKHTKW